MYVAVLTRGSSATLVRTVETMTSEMAAAGAGEPLFLWIHWRGSVSPALVEACERCAAPHRIPLLWRFVSSELTKTGGGVASALKRALSIALDASPEASSDGTTRLLVARESAGQSVVFVDDGIVGAMVDEASTGSPWVIARSSRSLVDDATHPRPCLAQAPAGTLLRLIQPETVPISYSTGLNVVQAGTIGATQSERSGIDPTFEIFIDPWLESPSSRWIVPCTTVTPLDRGLTSAWAASASVATTFFPPAFEGASMLWTTVARALRPSIRLVHLPVACIRVPESANGHYDEGALDLAVLRWRTNEWLSHLYVDAVRRSHRHTSAVARELASVSGSEWSTIIDRSLQLRRRILLDRAARFEIRARAIGVHQREVAGIMRAVAAEYRSGDCWIPNEWRTRSSHTELQSYATAVWELALACAEEAA